MEEPCFHQKSNAVLTGIDPATGVEVSEKRPFKNVIFYKHSILQSICPTRF
jgi:hypothetical protein